MIPEGMTTLTLSTFIFLASQLRCPPSHDRYRIISSFMWFLAYKVW